MASKLMSSKMITIRGSEFMKDFKELTSSQTEMLAQFKKAGLSASVFYNWTHRLEADGTCRVSKDTYKRLVDISGLSYDKYYIGETSYFKSPSSPRKSASNVKTVRLKNGITVSTYTKPAEDPIKPAENPKDTFQLALSSFRSHLEIYRRLLGIHTSTMVNTYNISNYIDIEDGKVVLSLSTYFLLSKIFIEQYNALEASPLKKAFEDLAASYNDIYVSSLYFGDSVKAPKKRR